ncbi:MAG TPA: TetR/AcrR family transcriptional regulator [Candidatus Binatia bacterium]|jgi:AcrR family transcriptional regulator|nr:TetR/AcrR family transcriptional regulator [Candidatus Binatia bacterium]
MPRRSTVPLAPRRRPRQARAQETTRAILEAAARVFAAHGYAAGTTNRIAEAAGVSIGSLYEYFPNKDAILVALMEQHIAEGETVMRALLAQPRPGKLRTVVRTFVQAMIALHAHAPRLHRVLFEEAPVPRPVWRTLAAVERRMVDDVERMLAVQPDVRVRDHALAARLVVQVIEDLTHRFVLHPDATVDAERYVDEVTTLVTSYLTRLDGREEEVVRPRP